MAGILSRFSFATATTIQQLKNSSNDENTVKSTAFWFSAWKKWCLEKGIAKEIQNYEPTRLSTRFVRTSGNGLSHKTWSHFLFAQHLEAYLMLGL